MTTPLKLPQVSAPTLSTDTSRAATADNLKAAGEKFESLFVGMMMKSMRSASLGEGLMDSQALEQFRDLQDKQTAEAMAQRAPFGIGKAMTEFLARSQPTLAQAPAADGSAGSTSTPS